MAKVGDRRTLEDGRVQELQRTRRGMGRQWVTVSGFLPGEQKVVGGEGSGGTYRVKTGKTFQTREGFHREQDPIGYAYYSAYGRAPTEAERNSWGQKGRKGNWESKSSATDIMRHLAVSPEGRRRGLDPGKYGVEEVDPEKLSDYDRQFYDEWRRYNPNKPFLNTDLDFLNWSQNAGNIEAFKAGLRGDIYDTAVIKDDGSPATYEDGSPITMTVITPQATQRAGENKIWLSGTKAGKLYYGDLANVKVSNVKQQGEINEDGFYAGVATGSPKEGLFGGDFGEFMTETLSDQLKFVIDPLNIGGGILFGQEYAQGIAQGGAALTGANVEDVQTVQSVANDVFSAALALVPGVGIPVAAAYRAASDYSEATMYGTSRTAAFQNTMKGTLVDAFTAGVASSFSAANAAASAANAGKGVTAFTKATQGTIVGATRGAVSGAVSGSDNPLQAIATGALVGGAGAAITTGVQAAFATGAEALAGTGIGQTVGFSPGSQYAQALVQAGSGFVGEYAKQNLRYAVDEQFRQEINNQIANGLVSNKEEAFLRASTAGAAMGVYNAFTQAAQKDFGTTLGDLAERPTKDVLKFTLSPTVSEDGTFNFIKLENVPEKQGYFSELSFATPVKEKIPGFQEMFLGEDKKFEFGDTFGGEGKGIAETFVEAAGIAVGGSLAMGLINPRTGPVGGYQFRGPPAGTPSSDYGLGGSTYGGYIQQDYAAAGTEPAGSEVIAGIAESGGF